MILQIWICYLVVGRSVGPWLNVLVMFVRICRNSSVSVTSEGVSIFYLKLSNFNDTLKAIQVALKFGNIHNKYSLIKHSPLYC